MRDFTGGEEHTGHFVVNRGRHRRLQEEETTERRMISFFLFFFPSLFLSLAPVQGRRGEKDRWRRKQIDSLRGRGQLSLLAEAMRCGPLRKKQLVYNTPTN